MNEKKKPRKQLLLEESGTSAFSVSLPRISRVDSLSAVSPVIRNLLPGWKRAFASFFQRLLLFRLTSICTVLKLLDF